MVRNIHRKTPVLESLLKKLQVFTNVLTEHLSTTASGNSSSKNECHNFEVYYKTRTMKLVDLLYF